VVTLAAVPLPTPDIDNMVEGLERLIEGVKAGEFVSLLIIAFGDDRKILSVERGKRLSRLEMVGLLEMWKVDLLKTMETDVPVQL
jgi:hypothetical protein